ncbi:DUF881 domain-containing protein [Metasolibacillus fluoroglycofenilyticus]|uniref:DUF881 domain-containing protein n=1 Tax=Metasolibacillus fluoroglycofenilyticus TaxID=1239396 RepID=UPI000D3C054B|nr:DUF881 domain-containing protein [Metasolibacillus fluoroglycofenilyticus]
MKNNQKNNRPSLFQRKYFIMLIVSIMIGFIIGISYNLTKDNKKLSSSSPIYFQQQETYREELITQQERNKELTEELNYLQQTIRNYEKQLTSSAEQHEDLVAEAERLRLLLGDIAGQGQGIRLTLADGEYDPNSTNPNDYIVHESHIFKVLTELKIAGAEAIAINGQRLKTNSYISCNGPVITIDGKQSPAPFVIEAIGEPDTLIASLEISGGVFDQLLNERISVTFEKSSIISMPSNTAES